MSITYSDIQRGDLKDYQDDHECEWPSGWGICGDVATEQRDDDWFCAHHTAAYDAEDETDDDE